MWRNPKSRAVFYAAVVWFAALGVAYLASRNATPLGEARWWGLTIEDLIGAWSLTAYVVVAEDDGRHFP